ncbi:hypothetical protein BN946_scf184799.g3 [Trametes cinnabarina]|uniref:Uncharacterized protein n=1 Tax=Pycnoporus cinnabarinus TaxID=5643 RepID=A0A060S2A0_PYCCI|nr:hypothetical protein BN946_scf184799.g3 [Trametes cinnabarina]
MSHWNDSSLRLPSYRESLVVRYHPYARKQGKPVERLMIKRTVDNRYDQEPTPVAENPGIPAHAVALPDALDDVAQTLDRALSRGVEDGLKRRRSLTSLIIDLALAVRNSYRSSRVSKKRVTIAKKK